MILTNPSPQLIAQGLELDHDAPHLTNLRMPMIRRRTSLTRSRRRLAICTADLGLASEYDDFAVSKWLFTSLTERSGMTSNGMLAAMGAIAGNASASI